MAYFYFSMYIRGISSVYLCAKYINMLVVVETESTVKNLM